MNTGYLTDIIILLSAAVITVPVFQCLGFGAIPGFLVAGAIVGPSGLGYIQDYDEIAQLAEFGVILLLFIIGIEIKPSSLWNIRRLVLGLGTLQVLITGALITVIAHEILNSSWEASLLIGLALALSSTAFVLQLLTERKMISSEYGRPSVAILLLQDLAVVPLLVFVSFMAEPELTIVEDILLALAEAFIILLFIIVLARYILTPLLKMLSRFGSPEIFTASALLLVLGSAYAMERIGLSMAMGAFVAGLLIADSYYRHQIIAEIQPFRGLLLGLFFMSMGMSLNIDQFLDHPMVLLSFTVALMTIKFFILWPLSRLFGIKKKASISVALLLAQSGEFALVLFAVAKSMGVLEETLFQHLLIVVLLSMLITPVLDKLAYRVFLASPRSITTMQNVDIDKHEQYIKPIIIAGFGRMGHRIGYIMELMKVPYLAIDKDESLVERERSKGKPVYFGDVQSLQVLRAAGATDAPFVIISINDPGVTEQIVSSLHSAVPDIPIFARGHDLAKCHDLRALGAHYTVSETLEASAELAHAALLHMGVEGSEIAIALEQFRKDYYKQVNMEEEKKTKLD
ncbi:monovalent cation:proton antiporter-2 (CPA2) family protein [Photobacterium sp. SDRW27]|uniref:monovalent cation:proton antiporter-2 (CPA2) family protein n=1 Tax=Photobacterium obscurum TaxID=2829490 RepID=UPI002243ED12|nr:monovalent cation:proton antiporter-2 (CPA2) family protein [Photobacterium obscurum]MCW8329859.1 monovalent cation:proton antiporter-2 (CPA2) family protein [Photobacterium obscurum]